MNESMGVWKNEWMNVWIFEDKKEWIQHNIHEYHVYEDMYEDDGRAANLRLYGR